MIGENNPFFGKKHKKETINLLKEKCKIASENKWKDQIYREHVLNSVIGLKRSDEFKETQRRHAIEQMKDPKQRELRSIALKKSWEEGNRKINIINSSISKQQIEFFEKLRHFIQVKEKYVVKYKNEITNKRKHLFPDGYIEKYNLIIEYNGSFWHADKRRYKSTDIIHHGVTAQEIWNKDNKRRQIFETLGYNYIEVWSDDYVNDKDIFIKKFYNKIKQLYETKN